MLRILDADRVMASGKFYLLIMIPILIDTIKNKNGFFYFNDILKKYLFNSIGSLGGGNAEAHVSDVTVTRARFFGSTNGVRIKTWQVRNTNTNDFLN